MASWLEIDLDQVIRNVQLIAKEVGTGVAIIGVVKSNAYNQGLEPICRALEQTSVRMLAVLSLEDARRVRRICSKPVLIMGYLDQRELLDAIREDFTLSLYDRLLIPTVERLASRVNKIVRAHLKINTGLNRLGLSEEEAIDFLINQHHFPHLKVEALFSHLAQATNQESNLKQLNRLQKLIVAIQHKAPILPMHLVSSGALGKFKEGYLDAVRIGIAFYGVGATLPGLLPTSRLKSVVVQVRTVAAGETIGYSRTVVVHQPTKVAVIALGYYDGFTSAIATNGEVIINGAVAPLLGLVGMNLLAVDVTSLREVKRGDEVIIIGSQRLPSGATASLTIEGLAKKTGLRHHEIITTLGRDLPRKYLGG